MKYLKYIDRYDRIKKLIHLENTGNAEDFSAKIGLSRRMLFEYLSDLRYNGVNILYCRKRKTYYFSPENEKFA
jgi:hypothetical protein